MTPLGRIFGRGAKDADDQMDLAPLLELSPDGVLGVDADSIVTLVNAKAEQLFGYEADEMIGTSAELFLPNLFGTAILGARTAYMSDPQARDMGTGLELFGRRADGSDFPAELASTPYILEGAPIVLLFVRDISARRAAQDAVVQRDQSLGRLVEASLDAIVGIDLYGVITSWNPRAQEILGWPADEVIGKPAGSVFVPERHRAAHEAEFARIMEEGDLGKRTETQALHSKGHEFEAEIAMTAYAVGDSFAVHAFIRDITDRKSQEAYLEREILSRTEELASAREAADAANRAKSSFLSNMSHEIRTPMNAILGFSQLMDRDPEFPPEHRERVQIVLRSGDHLLGLINDVLDMSKIEAGQITLNPNRFDLHQVVRDMETMFRVRTDEKGLELSINLESGLPQYVRTDEGKLKQIIINVLGNAVKFTEHGGITLRASAQEDGGGVVHLHLEVEDTGAGIAEDELDSVFEAFEQTESGRTSQAGTGLGMPISKQFARLMEGDLTVRSEVGVGTTFTLEIIAESASSDESEATKSLGRVRGLAEGQDVPTILVVDDKPLNVQLLRELLDDVGVSCVEASDGAEALERFDEVRPDLVFMDVKMPVMDGLEATRTIRAKSPDAGSQTPVVMLTASVFGEDQSTALAAGADAFIMKPFKEAQIWAVLESLLKLEFVRETKLADEQVQIAEFTSEDVAGLGSAVVAALRQAIRSADLDMALTLLDPLAQDHPDLVAHLRTLISAFEFDGLTELVGEADS